MTDRAEYGRGWKRLRRHVLERDGWLCAWCGIDLRQHGVTASVDHVVSIKAGELAGWTRAELNDPSNLVASCSSCNSSRAARPGPPRRARPGFLTGSATTSRHVSGSLSPVPGVRAEPGKGQRWTLGPGKGRQG